VVLKKEFNDFPHSELWYVDFWESSLVMTARAQITLLHACSAITLVLLLFQALRLLREFCLALKPCVNACLNSHADTRTAVLAIAGRFASRALQRFQSICKGKDADVLHHYNSRRIARVQGAMWIIQPVFSLILLGNIHSRPGAMIWSFFDPPEEQDPHTLLRALASTGLLPCVLLFAWATFFSACPRLLSVRALDCSSAALTAAWALQFGVVQNKSRKAYNDTMAWMDIVQVLAATVLGNAVLATPLQVVLTAVRIHSTIRSNLSETNLSGGTYSSSHEPMHHLTLLMLFLSFIWLMDWQTWREAEAIVKAKQADNSSHMVSRLLGSICDAVVPVDKSLCVGAAGSPQLAALLMHHGSHATPPLQGASLINLAKSDEDQHRLQDFMMRELTAARAGFGTRAPVASSLQVHLHDAFDIPVPVEIFCSCSLGAEAGGIGELQFLIGVREQDANRVMQERQHTRDLQLMNMDDGRTTQERQANMKRLDRISEWDISGSDSDISSETSTLHQQMSVWVDMGSEDLTILRWTPGVASLLQQPSPKGDGFLTWLVQEQRQDFSAWLQARPTEDTETSRSITLQLPCKDVRQQGRNRSQKRFFTCARSVFDGSEEIRETSNPSEVRGVRLDLHEYQKKRFSNRVPRQSASQPTILLWVEEQTKCVLKSKHAPRSMFQVGSYLTVVEEGDQQGETIPRLFRHLMRETIENEMFGTEPSDLGAFTLASGGYQLHGELALVNTGQHFQGVLRSWFLISISNGRLLGRDGSEQSVQGQAKQSI